MEITFRLFRIVLVLAFFSLSTSVMGASVKRGVQNPRIVDKLERPLSDTMTSEVVDKDKCPELTPGGGAGDLKGGMCFYPKPAGKQCSDFDGCSDVHGEEKCRCKPADKCVGTGGTSGPGQVQSSGG